MINLKDNIWIEGLDFESNISHLVSERNNFHEIDELIYSGKTSEIPEEIAEKCVMLVNEGSKYEAFHNYYLLSKDPFVCIGRAAGNTEYINWKYSAKESIQTACNKEYCIIYKK